MSRGKTCVFTRGKMPDKLFFAKKTDGSTRQLLPGQLYNAGYIACNCSDSLPDNNSVHTGFFSTPEGEEIGRPGAGVGDEAAVVEVLNSWSKPFKKSCQIKFAQLFIF